MPPDIEMQRGPRPAIWRKILAFVVTFGAIALFGIAQATLTWRFTIGVFVGAFMILGWFRLKYGYWLDYR